MPTRTAPAVDGASMTGYNVAFRLIDESGDRRSISFQFVGAVAPSDALLEAVAAELQGATNASLYEVQVVTLYSGAADAANADTAAYASVKDNVVINFRDDVARDQFSAYIPAPLAAIMIGNDTVDNTNADYLAYRNAVATLFPTFTPVTARFTERVERNSSGPA